MSDYQRPRVVTSFLSENEVKSIGFRAVGKNVKISRYARFYFPELIEIGENSRIDDFSILSGSILIGKYVHVSAYVALYGRYGIEINDYSGLSARCIVYSATDDFSGEYMIGPELPKSQTHIIGGKVVLEKYVQIGAGTIILPDLIVGEGVAVGAMSLIKKSLPPWKICAGIPAVILRDRSKTLLNFIS